MATKVTAKPTPVVKKPVVTAKPTPPTTTQTVKAPVAGQTQYVGGQLQYVSPTGVIQAPDTAPVGKGGTGATPTPQGTGTGTGTPPPLKLGDPGYVLKPGDPGYVLQPGDPGYVAPGGTGGGAGTQLTPAQIQTMIDTGVAAGLAGLNTQAAADKSAQQADYVKALTSLLGSYGIGDLSGSVVAAVQKGYTPDTINLIMQDPTSSDPLALAYQARFPANAILFKKGQPVLSPAQYLNNEQAYTAALQSYGLSKYATPANFTSLIANDISPSEATSRLALGVNSVQNADQATKDALTKFYPSLNQNDIVAAVLDPTQGLSDLQQKVTTAQIGGAAGAQGLDVSLAGDQTSMGASALAALGVTQAQAQTGYGNLASYLPDAQKLSDIYTNQTAGYNQATGEADVFQNLASAQQARMGLNNLETASFAGSSGTLGPSLGTPRSSFNSLDPGQF